MNSRMNYLFSDCSWQLGIIVHLFVDSFIQKTKQRYNNTRTLTSRLNLSEMSEDLHNNPPFQILQAELGPENNADVKTYKTGGECLYSAGFPLGASSQLKKWLL